MDKANGLPATLQEAVIYFAIPENCHNFMVALRWPDGKVKCPLCGSEGVSYLPNARVFKCYKGHERNKFSLKVGTIFEDSPLGLDKWLPVMWLVVNCKNGVSSYEIRWDIGVTQKTAWFMLQRCRLAMQDEHSGGELGGFGTPVEVDESFIDGKVRNMHKDRKVRAQKPTDGDAGKAIVLAVPERGGKVRAKVISDRKADTIRPFVKEHAERSSEVHSDVHGVNLAIDEELPMRW